jgi:ABC-type oligopeptide transport system substrate-binding subunit
MRIRCQTLFDITATGVTGHFKPSRIPFLDSAGTSINSEASWNRARNQQRNWETVTQIISLRTQVDFTSPTHDNNTWTFEFEIINDQLFVMDQDPLAVLKTDCADVPMITGLGEEPLNDTVLVVDKNIWFTMVPINTL